MHAIPLRVPPELARILSQKAAQMKTSLNRAVIRILEEAAGIAPAAKKPSHHDLDRLAGTWTKREADELHRAVESQRSVDPELWK